jgi:hypothetical protein
MSTDARNSENEKEFIQFSLCLRHIKVEVIRHISNRWHITQ